MQRRGCEAERHQRQPHACVAAPKPTPGLCRSVGRPGISISNGNSHAATQCTAALRLFCRSRSSATVPPYSSSSLQSSRRTAGRQPPPFLKGRTDFVAPLQCFVARSAALSRAHGSPTAEQHRDHPGMVPRECLPHLAVHHVSPRSPTTITEETRSLPCCSPTPSPHFRRPCNSGAPF